MDTSCIMGISDTQSPAHHIDAVDFIAAVVKKFKPTLTVHIGDLADFHRLNFHGVNPNLPSAYDELMMARRFTKELAKVCPKMYVMASNHDALPMRKARSAGLIDEMIKDVPSILQAPKTWKFQRELVLTLPNKIRAKFRHNFSAKLLADSHRQGQSLICGHFHTKSNIEWWQNDFGHNFCMQLGSMVDRTHPALDYQGLSSVYPVLTIGILRDGIPMLVPMILNKKGRWVRYV